jgi:hypothetical protein
MKLNQVFFVLLLLSVAHNQLKLKKLTYKTEKIQYISKNILGFENLFGDGLKARKILKYLEFYIFLINTIHKKNILLLSPPMVHRIGELII